MTTQAPGARTRRPGAYRPPAPLGGRGSLRHSPRHRLTVIAFLTPAIVILTVFVAWPMISALRLSFTDASGFGREKFVGLDNYVRVFTDGDIVRAMGNTAVYAVLFTPVAIALALAFALLLNNPLLPLRGVFRTALFTPFIVSLAVAAFAWSYLLDPQVGLLNHWLRAVWKSFGFYMVIFLAGLQDIPTSLYEAARVDGASALQRFWSITLPMLSNTLGFVVIVALIAALQAFDQIYVMTGGGPYGSTQTIVMEIYQSGFRKLDLGFASALSYVLLLITLVLSLAQFLFFSRREKDAA